MFAVNGFAGLVARNDARSLMLFAIFQIAFQVATAVVLTPILWFVDGDAVPLLFPGQYALDYALPVFVAGIVLFGWHIVRHVRSIRKLTGYVEIERRLAPDLHDMIEGLAVRCGIEAPRLGMIDTPALNAFACGLRRSDARIVVTSGLVNELTAAELEAVLAHEMAHIRNGDVRTMAVATAMLEAVITVGARNLLKARGKRLFLLAFLPPVAFMFLVSTLMVEATMRVARWARLSISTSREFVADAEAVRLTHDPGALVAALRKVEGRSHIPGIDPHLQAIMIDGAVAGEAASHPPVAARVAMLLQLGGSLAREGLDAVERVARPTAQPATTPGFGKRRTVPSIAPAQPWTPPATVTAPAGIASTIDTFRRANDHTPSLVETSKRAYATAWKGYVTAMGLVLLVLFAASTVTLPLQGIPAPGAASKAQASPHTAAGSSVGSVLRSIGR